MQPGVLFHDFRFLLLLAFILVLLTAFTRIQQTGNTKPDPRSSFAVLPAVTTSEISDVRGNSARAGGIVTSNNERTVIALGLCWSTSPNPTTSCNTTDSFDEAMTGLLPNTVYYLRAFATNAVGTGYGNQINFNSGHLIGSIYAGGLVFYNDGKSHGLVCAYTDQSTAAEWGCYGTTIGGTSAAINTGAANTDSIIAKCPVESVAARLCHDLVLNTYCNWFLPSKDELNLMYTNLHKQKLGNFDCHYYWSSSEYNFSYVWIQYFCNGNQCNDYKNYTYHVRAIRAF